MSSLTRLALSASAAALLACGGSPAEKPAPASPAKAAALVQKATTVRASARAAGAVAPPSRPANFDIRAQDEAARAAPSLRARSFEWLARTPVTPSAAALVSRPRDPVSAARAYLGLGADAALRAAGVQGAVDEAVVAAVHDLGRGPVIVQFERRVAGIEVFGQRTAVAMTQGLDLVARSGDVPVATRAAPALAPFSLSGQAAIAAALTDLTGDVYAAGDLASAPSQTADLRATLAVATAAARGVRLAAPARARKVLFPLGKGLVPAYRVEVALERPMEPLLAYAYVVSAVDGAVLVRRDQVQSEAFTYGVWAAPAGATDAFLPYDGPQGLAGTPEPTATPEHYDPGTVDQNAVSLQSFPFSRNDPWLPATATETVGNNVDAYADISGNDGYDAQDFRAQRSGALTFSYPYDFTIAPDATAAEQQAAIVQLFYDNNFFHDWYYDSGFDEASGNAQASNFGRGGEEGDPLHAEAQDSGGTNNANMWTPADGTSPRMQMYLWTGNGACNVQVSAPAEIATTYAAAGAEFGPQAFDLTGEVVAVTPASGCSALTSAAAVAGKIALVDRGSCTFKTKVLAAQDAGAIGVIIRNTPTSSQSFGTMGDDPTITATITVPAQLVQLADGATIGGASGVAARLYRPQALMRDGTIDNLIVAHEWGHFISNRLIGDGAGLESQQAGGLGEGWGDTHALLLAVREADLTVDTNATWNGTYGLAGWATGGLDAMGLPNAAFYFGIRRVPYSTDLQKDPLTFRDIANGQRLVPEGSSIPIAFGADGADNAEVHNAGEVWATMLWECYAALLGDTQRASPRTFDAIRAQWKDYLVASYKLMPLNPTFLEARDALLAAAYATDQRDYQLFWQAFAKRGAGVGAIGPDKWFSPDNTPVVESYEANPHLTLVSAAFGSTGGCTDGDAYLDAGEQGTLTLTLRNDGATPLPASTAAVSVDAAALTVESANLSLPAIDPGTSQTVDVAVSLAALNAPAGANLTLTFPEASDLAGATLTLPLALNRDEVPTSSSAEDFSTATGFAAWTVDGAVSGTPGWQHVGSTAWGTDADQASDLRLVTPPLQVAEGGDLTLAFEHRYGFEGGQYASGWHFFDGGVIELTEDGGATWTDIGCPDGGDYCVYDWYLDEGGTNPLAGRPAFLYYSLSYPDYDAVSIDLGTAYAGKTVQIRFRIGSDEATGADGWTIRRVVVGGTVNTPFTSVHLDAGKCANRTAGGASSGGCSTGTGMGSLTALLLAFGALALRRPRRRRSR